MKKKSVSKNNFDVYVLTKEEADRIEKAYLNASPRLSMMGVYISAAISVICSIISIYINTVNPLVLVLIMVVLVVAILLLFHKVIIKRETEKLRGIVVKTSLEKSRYTGICLITQPQAKSNDIKLVAEKDNSEYIAYVDLKLCMKDGVIDTALIIKELSVKMDIEKECIERVVHLASKCSTKFARNSNYKLEQTTYEFYHVYFKPENKNSINDKIEKSNLYQWELLSRLKSKDEVRNQNRDVLSIIQELIIDEDTFDEMHNNSFPEDTRIKIIWNIADTEKCGQGCAICATHSQRKSLTADQKSTVLTQILAYADHISEIDFSGGDPLLLKEDRDLILRAINNLGNDKVFVTTTQKGIKQAKDQKDKNLKKYLYNSEVTLDLGKLEDEKRKEYNSWNKKLFNNMINHLNDYATNIYVNVPIVNVEVSDAEIKDVVNTIKMLKRKTKRVNLIRLMKVGKCDFNLPDTSDKAKTYRQNLTKVIDTFELFAKDLFPVHLHCALRGVKEEYICDMREKKIGIDCAGNVFICAWGAYIDKGTKYREDNNPFYIGSALNNSLEEILNSSRENGKVVPIKGRKDCACCIYSYLADGNPYSGKDFLFSCCEQSDLSEAE